MKLPIATLGTFLVCGVAVGALVVNQTAHAQLEEPLKPRPGLMPGMVLRSQRITSADPGFRVAAAGLLSSVRASQISNPSPGDKVGASIVDSSVYKDFFSTRAISWKPGENPGARVAQLTPGQLALAETLFAQSELSGAKNLAISSNRIVGSVSPKEVGLSSQQLKQRTIARLEGEIKQAKTAIGELQG